MFPLNIFILVVQSKGQTISKAISGLLNSSKKRTKLTILSKEDAQNSEFCLFFGRIEDNIILVVQSKGQTISRFEIC